MCIRLDNEYMTGEQVTCSFDTFGDMYVFPCKTRATKLLPEWQAAHLSRVQIYAMIEDKESHAVRDALHKLGAPEETITWLQNGHSVRFTCTNGLYLCELLRKYNGLI